MGLWVSRLDISRNGTAWQHPNGSKLANSRWSLGRILLEPQRNASGWQITWYEQDPHESQKVPHLPLCRHLLMMTSATPSWVPSWRPSFSPHPSTRNKASQFKKNKGIHISTDNLVLRSATFMGFHRLSFKCFIEDYSQHNIRACCKKKKELKLFRTQRDVSELSAVCRIKSFSLAFNSLHLYLVILRSMTVCVQDKKRFFVPYRHSVYLIIISCLVSYSTHCVSVSLSRSKKQLGYTLNYRRCELINCFAKSLLKFFIVKSGFLHICGNEKRVDEAQNGPILSVHEIVFL